MRGMRGHGDHVAQFRRLFWVMAALAVPTVALSPMFAMLLGYDLPDFPGARWISPVLGTVMYVWGGRPFLTGAISEIRSRAPGMMLLIGLAITVAFIASWGASLGVLHHELDFWWELALLIVIMLLGHWIEMRSLAQTTSALDSLAALLPDEAERVEGDGEAEQVVTVAPADLRVGDLVIVRPGGSVPVDGRIVDGAADMDESMVTGESRTVRRSVGDDVVAGTVATDSGLRIRVTAVGDDTALAGIQRLVGEAMNSSSRAQRLADRAAGWLFWFALGSAVADRAGVDACWASPTRPWSAPSPCWSSRARTPSGLAIPLVVSIATERARPRRGADQGPPGAGKHAHRRRGAVRQDRHAHQGRADRDRRGGHGGRPENEVLALAAAAEADSEHPLAQRHRRRRTPPRARRCPAASDFSSSPAVGRHAHGSTGSDRPGRRARAARAGRPSRAAGQPARGATRAPSCCTSWSTEQWSARWRWPTRSGRSPARPSTRCTSWASRW